MRVQIAQATIVFATAMATFVPALNNGLFADDVLLIEARLAQSRVGPAEYFRENYWGDFHDSGLYRPLSLAALSVQRRFFGFDRARYRVVNLLLHGVCSVLVLLLLQRLLMRPLAFAGAMLFAVHPIHAEAVTAIYGQEDLLGALFFLVALIIAVESAGADAPVRVALTGGCYLLSLLSKEQGVLLPLLVPVMRRYVRGQTSQHPLRLRRSDIAMFAALGVYVLLRIAALGHRMMPSGAASVAYGYPWWARINLVVVTVGTYLRLLVLPSGQTTYYGHLRDSIFSWPVHEFVAVLAGVLLMRPLQEVIGRRVVVPAYLFLAVTLFPVANVLQIGVVVAERCMYLPVFAVCLIVPAIVFQVARAPSRIWMGVFSALVVASAILSVRVAIRWQTPLSHWAATISDHQRSAGAHARFALLLLQEAALDAARADDPRIARAEQETNRALQINRGLPEAWHARGLLALRRGDCAAATAALEQALLLRPVSAEITNALHACR
jgi:hypothetical protein